jgi:hypothetical protein
MNSRLFTRYLVRMYVARSAMMASTSANTARLMNENGAPSVSASQIFSIS